MLKIGEAFLYKVNNGIAERGRKRGAKNKKEPGILIIRIIDTMVNSCFRVFLFKKIIDPTTCLLSYHTRNGKSICSETIFTIFSGKKIK